MFLEFFVLPWRSNSSMPCIYPPLFTSFQAIIRTLLAQPFFTGIFLFLCVLFVGYLGIQAPLTVFGYWSLLLLVLQ